MLNNYGHPERGPWRRCSARRACTLGLRAAGTPSSLSNVSVLMLCPCVTPDSRRRNPRNEACRVERVALPPPCPGGSHTSKARFCSAWAEPTNLRVGRAFELIDPCFANWACNGPCTPCSPISPSPHLHNPTHINWVERDDTRAAALGDLSCLICHGCA